MEFVMVGVVHGGAVVEGHVSAHVVEGLGQHAGDVDLHLTAVRAGRGELPRIAAVGGAGTELNGDVAGRGQVNRILDNLRVRSGVDDAGVDDGNDGGGVVLLRRCCEFSSDREVRALRQDCRRGVVAGGIDRAGGDVAAGNAVHQPGERAWSGGREVRGLPRRECDVLRSDRDRADAAAGGRRPGRRGGDGSLGWAGRNHGDAAADREEEGHGGDQEGTIEDARRSHCFSARGRAHPFRWAGDWADEGR